MIENKNEASKNLEKALQALEQAKQRVANKEKKQNERKRKAENYHKYIMGSIVVKYFPDYYHYDEGELNHILSVALQTRECQQIITKIKAEIYTRNKGRKPDTISLSQEFFDGADIDIEIKTKVIYESDKDNIINEYIVFCKVFNEQIKEHGMTKQAVTETICISCR